jgi:glycosyltransferase involved in cell wall biosynthesis
LARFLRNKRVAVAHSFDFYTNLMLIPAARLAGVAAVVGSHRQLGDLLTSRQFQAQKMAFRWCDRIVCNSQAAAERLGKPAWADRVSIIGNGIAPENFVAANPALPREPGSVRVGMVARMNDRGKQHEMFLRAAARLAPQIPSLSFVLAGDGPLRPPMEQLARELGLAQRVLFLGERRDIPAVLAALDVSVLTSNSESLSNVILESMAAGVPVVAADVGGNPELVQNGRTGLLFPAKSEEGLAEALRTLISQPELRRRMGVESLARVRAEFTVTAIRDRYQSLYHQILTEKSWFRASGKEPQYAVGNCN